MANPSASSVLGKFIWYDQMSNDLPGAEKFYAKVVGWTIAPNTMNAQRYSLLKSGETMVGGLMPIPEEAAKMGVRPAWMGYIAVDDVKAYADKVKAAGGAIHRPPTEIPNVGDIRRRQRSERRRIPSVQGQQRPGAGRGPLEARPYRLARTARGRPGKLVRLLLRPVRLDEGRSDGHGRDGDLPDLHHQGPAARRHDEEDGAGAGRALALLHQRRGDRRGLGAGQVRRRQGRERTHGGSRRKLGHRWPRSARGDVRARCAEAGDRAASALNAPRPSRQDSILDPSSCGELR